MVIGEKDHTVTSTILSSKKCLGHHICAVYQTPFGKKMLCAQKLNANV
jgi:hypothetical protein